MPPRVLVVDDDASLRFTLEAVLSDAGLTVEVTDGGASGIAAFEARGADVVLTDLAMPDVDGMQVLARIRAQDPSVPVLMLTAHGSERVAVAAMKAGAYDYLPKPFDPDELVLAVKRGIETRELRLQNARLRTEAQLGRAIVAESPAMRRVLDMITRVAPKDVTVLITGESGAGKDVMATALHAHSRRADKPFVRFNAAAIPSELAEAELFGHTKGAFTGATQARQGYFQQADKGTLFIDEIGELPLAIQAKILRALQSGEVQQVGGRAETVDVRLIAATNRDLGRRREGGALPRGSVLPAERRADSDPAAARAARGRGAAHADVRAAVRRPVRDGAGRGGAGAGGRDEGACVAGERARSGEHRGAAPGARAGRTAHARAVAIAGGAATDARRAGRPRRGIRGRAIRCGRAWRRSSGRSSRSSSRPRRGTRARRRGGWGCRGRR